MAEIFFLWWHAYKNSNKTYLRAGMYRNFFCMQTLCQTSLCKFSVCVSWRCKCDFVCMVFIEECDWRESLVSVPTSHQPSFTHTARLFMPSIHESWENTIKYGFFFSIFKYLKKLGRVYNVNQCKFNAAPAY